MNQPTIAGKTPPSLRASRLKLLLIVGIFMAPILAAGVLTFSGWQPEGKANGVAITPQRNFADEHLRVALSHGGDWAWRASEPKLTLIALAGPGCAVQCVDTLTKMAAARITLNQNADRLRLLYVGAPPQGDAAVAMQHYWQVGSDTEDKLASFRPGTPDSVSALLVESNGTALSLYPSGFDPTGLRKDLQKVIR
jgi:cytochrome oxidase Cu insertion factor (SCO1/SenC/PrrC family)